MDGWVDRWMDGCLNLMYLYVSIVNILSNYFHLSYSLLEHSIQTG